MKKIIVMIMSVILCFGLVSCEGSEAEQETIKPEEIKITDCVDSMTVEAVEDGVIYWNIKFNEKFNDSEFEDSADDYYNLLKKCLNKEENLTAGVIDYWIVGYDAAGMLRFSWGVQDYGTLLMYDKDGNAFTGSDYPLIDYEIQELKDSIPKQ